MVMTGGWFILLLLYPEISTSCWFKPHQIPRTSPRASRWACEASDGREGAEGAEGAEGPEGAGTTPDGDVTLSFFRDLPSKIYG